MPPTPEKKQKLDRFGRPVPQTKGDEILYGLQGLTPHALRQRTILAGKDVANDLKDWWNAPSSTAEADAVSGLDTGSLFSNYLGEALRQSYGRNDLIVGPAPQGYGINLPAPPNMPGPDFSLVDAAMAGAAPQKGSIDEKKYINRSAGLGAISQAIHNDPDEVGYGTWMMRAALGALGGKLQGQMSLQDRRDLEEKDQREYQLRLAGVEADKASALASVAQENVRNHYNYQLQMAKLQMDQAAAMQPKINATSKGVVITYTGADGQTHVQMRPFGEDSLEGLGGSTESEAMQLALTNGDPAMAAKAMVKQLARRGQLQTIFGDVTQEVEQEISKRMPADFRVMGSTGQKAWLPRFTEERDWKLAEILMNNPEYLQTTYELLTGKQAPTE